MFLARYGLCKGDKYYTFLQKLYNYLNENDVILDKEKEQLQPRYNDEDTLEYYENVSKNLDKII